MNDLNKYLSVAFLAMASFLAIILVFVLIFFIMKLMAVTVFAIPGFNMFFRYIITVIPYLIFFGGYYFLFTQIEKTGNSFLQKLSITFMLSGVLSCFLTMVVLSLIFFGLKRSLLYEISDNTGIILVAQLVILVICSIFLAIGEPKEVDWMERGKEGMKE
jgi:glucan phosphoethanolaminetransferase (alkaline phosphatase superfamily)